MKTVLDCGLALRPAMADDVPYMADCIRETLKASVPPEEAELADLWTDTMTAVALDSLSTRKMQDEVFILTDGDSRRGMLWTGISRDQYNAEPSGYLLGIYVDPSVRRRGIGKELVACAESWCSDRGLAYMQLDVGSSNEAASALYASMGYTPRSSVLTKQLLRCRGM